MHPSERSERSASSTSRVKAHCIEARYVFDHDRPRQDEFRIPMKEIRQGQQWIIDIAHVLDAPLPDLDMPKPSVRSNQGTCVQQQLNHYLSQLQKQRGLSDWLMEFRRHLIDITGRWGDDLFVCYDIAGVPPTNNTLESRFGRLPAGSASNQWPSVQHSDLAG